MKELKVIIKRLFSLFVFRPSRKFYTTYTRRMQLVQQFRTLKKQSEADNYNRVMSSMRERLKLETK